VKLLVYELFRGGREVKNVIFSAFPAGPKKKRAWRQSGFFYRKGKLEATIYTRAGTGPYKLTRNPTRPGSS